MTTEIPIGSVAIAKVNTPACFVGEIGGVLWHWRL